MRILYIDLASHSQRPQEGACIACVTEAHTASIRFVDHRIGDDGLMPMLDDVLEQASWSSNDLTHVACVTGPGGFTSLRMAVTLANVYADQLKLPLAGIRLDEVYEERVEGQRWTGNGERSTVDGRLLTVNGQRSTVDFMWIHATKKTELFVRGYGSYASLWPEATLVPLAELVERFPHGAPVAGELLPEQRAALEQKGLQDADMVPVADTLPALLPHRPYGESQIVPWYGRGW